MFKKKKPPRHARCANPKFSDGLFLNDFQRRRLYNLFVSIFFSFCVYSCISWMDGLIFLFICLFVHQCSIHQLKINVQKWNISISNWNKDTTYQKFTILILRHFEIGIFWQIKLSELVITSVTWEVLVTTSEKNLLRLQTKIIDCSISLGNRTC